MPTVSLINTLLRRKLINPLLAVTLGLPVSDARQEITISKMLSICRPQIRKKKWWWNLFRNELNLAVFTGWLLHKATRLRIAKIITWNFGKMSQWFFYELR